MGVFLIFNNIPDRKWSEWNIILVVKHYSYLVISLTSRYVHSWWKVLVIAELKSKEVFYFILGALDCRCDDKIGYYPRVGVHRLTLKSYCKRLGGDGCCGPQSRTLCDGDDSLAIYIEKNHC